MIWAAATTLALAAVLGFVLTLLTLPGLWLLVLLSLEFMPRRRRLPAATGWE